MNSQNTEHYTKEKIMKELKELINAIRSNIHDIPENIINNGQQVFIPVVPLQYISEELELASRVSNIDAETLDKAYVWLKRNDYNVDINIVTNVISIVVGDFDIFELSTSEILQRAKMFNETYAEECEEIKLYDDLNIDELFNLSEEYSNYVQECSYYEYKPVSIYEFYEIQYQQIIKEKQND